MRDEVRCSLPSESSLVCPSHHPHLEIIHTTLLKIPPFLLSLVPNIKIPSITQLLQHNRCFLSLLGNMLIVTEHHEIKSNQTLI